MSSADVSVVGSRISLPASTLTAVSVGEKPWRARFRDSSPRRARTSAYESPCQSNPPVRRPSTSAEYSSRSSRSSSATEIRPRSVAETFSSQAAPSDSRCCVSSSTRRVDISCSATEVTPSLMPVITVPAQRMPSQRRPGRLRTRHDGDHHHTRSARPRAAAGERTTRPCGSRRTCRHQAFRGLWQKGSKAPGDGNGGRGERAPSHLLQREPGAEQDEAEEEYEHDRQHEHPVPLHRYFTPARGGIFHPGNRA